MSQYKIGTISITNGSASVTITSASSGAENVAVGDSFKVDRDGEAIYLLASRTPSSGASLTAVTLTTTYGGATGSGLGYQITTDYTPNRSYPELSQGDADAADWITRTLRKIDQDMALLLGTGSALAISNNQVGFWSSGLTGSPNLTWNGTSFAIGTAGPHAIGGATVPTQQLTQTGSFTGNIATRLSTTLAVAVSTEGYGMLLDPILTKAASGTHAVLAGLAVVPAFGSGLASVSMAAGISLSAFTAPASTTTAAELYIAGAPTGATSNYALFVDAGSTRLDGNVHVGSVLTSASVALGEGIVIDGATVSTLRLQGNTGSQAVELRQSSTSFDTFGANSFDFLWSPNGSERMRLTSGGVLAIGTTVTTGASAGGLVLKNDTGTLYGVNAAGTAVVGLLRIDSGNRVLLSPDGNDIRIGQALIALGGGATPTLGTIGGSGPAVAAQNSWMRVVDSAGVPFWVPAWK